MASAADIIVAGYNLFQIVAWTAVLVFIIMSAVNAESFMAWSDSYEGWLKLSLEIAQGMTILDILFTSLGWTPNAFLGVFLQTVGRLYVVFMICPTFA